MKKLSEILPLVAQGRNQEKEKARQEVKDPKCICGGTGYLRRDVPVGDPNFGRLYPCVCKLDEIAVRQSFELASLSNLGPLSSKTFENFERSWPGVENAYGAARNYAGDPRGWLIMIGKSGSGKTHLAAAVANEVVLSLGLKVIFTIAPELLEQLRRAYDPKSEISFDDRLDALRNADLLIVDDLGTEQVTPWAAEKLYLIFNHRYNYSLPTVVTTNRRLENFDERLTSRLSDRTLSRHVVLDRAGDYRRRELTDQERMRIMRLEK